MNLRSPLFRTLLPLLLLCPALAFATELVIWYEVIAPVRVSTVDGGPAAADYSNLDFILPPGHRIVAHAVGPSAAAPECVPGDAAMVLPSHDLCALGAPGAIEICPACLHRHGDARRPYAGG